MCAIPDDQEFANAIPEKADSTYSFALDLQNHSSGSIRFTRTSKDVVGCAVEISGQALGVPISIGRTFALSYKRVGPALECNVLSLQIQPRSEAQLASFLAQIIPIAIPLGVVNVAKARCTPIEYLATIRGDGERLPYIANFCFNVGMPVHAEKPVLYLWQNDVRGTLESRYLGSLNVKETIVAELEYDTQAKAYTKGKVSYSENLIQPAHDAVQAQATESGWSFAYEKKIP
jgi:hypothetical protein